MSEAQLLTVYWIFAAERYGMAVYLKENQLEISTATRISSLSKATRRSRHGNKVCDKIVDNAMLRQPSNLMTTRKRILMEPRRL